MHFCHICSLKSGGVYTDPLHHGICPSSTLKILLNILIVGDLKSLIIIFERSWLSWEVPEDWRKEDIIPAFKKDDLENNRQVSLTSVLGKVMERILLETLGKHMKNKKVIGSSHNWFVKKTYFASLMAFCGEIWWPWRMKEEQQVSFILTLWETFDSIP